MSNRHVSYPTTLVRDLLGPTLVVWAPTHGVASCYLGSGPRLKICCFLFCLYLRIEWVEQGGETRFYLWDHMASHPYWVLTQSILNFVPHPVRRLVLAPVLEKITTWGKFVDPIRRGTTLGELPHRSGLGPKDHQGRPWKLESGELEKLHRFC